MPDGIGGNGLNQASFNDRAPCLLGPGRRRGDRGGTGGDPAVAGSAPGAARASVAIPGPGALAGLGILVSFDGRDLRNLRPSPVLDVAERGVGQLAEPADLLAEL